MISFIAKIIYRTKNINTQARCDGITTQLPDKKEWIQWALQEWKKFYGTCRTSEEFLEKAKLEVSQIGGKFLHMGKKTFE